MRLEIPAEVQNCLTRSSTFATRTAAAGPTFTSNICGSDWDRFIEQWASRCYVFVAQALGPYAKEPKSVILDIHDGAHSGGANASFQPDNGQVRLSPSIVENHPGITLEKITHEFTHASLAAFPEGDPFYEEGFVDYSVWVMAHAPIWGEHRQAMIDAAAFNIECRRDRALRDTSDYDRKRWAGGLFCSLAHGPWIVSRLKLRKAGGELQW
jgi:hypothetical protein